MPKATNLTVSNSNNNNVQYSEISESKPIIPFFYGKITCVGHRNLCVQI